MNSTIDPGRYVAAISRRGLSIYDPIEIGDPELWIPSPELEKLLDTGLRGLSLRKLPLRTRSKVIKETVCKILGYPVPISFRKTHPRFPGQLFDTYGQKSNNLQVWNEELSPTRRYVIIRVSASDVVEKVKVVTGASLALLDTTGTLTQKYQARFIPGAPAELVSQEDTENLQPLTSARAREFSAELPTDHPREGLLLAIRVVYDLLRPLVGRVIVAVGSDQERARAAGVHQLVCKALGYRTFADDGQFPDVRNQLIEVKLQTSPTIDLGMVRPNSTDPLDVPKIRGRQIRHCDVRYAIFCGKLDGKEVALTHFCLSTGKAFFSRFPQFGGKVLNKKLQIPLPKNFFDQ